MICEVCEKEIGRRGYAVIVNPEPIHGCKECMEIVEQLIKGECNNDNALPILHNDVMRWLQNGI